MGFWAEQLMLLRWVASLSGWQKCLPACTAPFPGCHLILRLLGHSVWRTPPPEVHLPVCIYPGHCKRNPHPSSLYTPPGNLCPLS